MIGPDPARLLVAAGPVAWLSPAGWSAVELSVLVALVAVAASLPLGIATAWLLARRDFPGKILLETAVNLPLVLPPVVTGYLLLRTIGTRGWLGGPLEEMLGLRLVFTWVAAALAAAVMSFPLMVRALRVAFAGVDPRLESAAATLGASPLRVFWTVTLPLARPGLVAACVLAFARSLGEFGATIMVAGSIPDRTRTIPLYVFDLLSTPGHDVEVGRLVVLSVALAAGSLLVGELLERRGRHDRPERPATAPARTVA